MPVELWIPDQDWLESTEMTVGQSECPEAADVSELREKEKGVIMFMCGLRSTCRGYRTLFPQQHIDSEFNKRFQRS